MKLLVHGKADVNLPDGKSGKTPLHHVVEVDELSIAAYLILQVKENPSKSVVELKTVQTPGKIAVITLKFKQSGFTIEYLHLPTISLDEPILDRCGSYTDVTRKRRHKYMK